ncbi:YihY/virulence factor BrkB family protein [Aureimonas sp. N4]|uniref:YihY/virulence factor BrkB family protein n=1 Tax=Aureimonas sp. N4 TaxID=1638165 RepID=UPI00078619E6|nr:YihY/virulence factor BrkB family protein [Aureimonas sp. N4]
MSGDTQRKHSATGDIILGLASAGALTVLGFIAGKSGVARERGWPGEAGGKDASAAWSDDPASGQGGKTSVAMGDSAHGRAAQKPTAIPAKGWKDVLWRTYEEFSNDRLMLVAAGVTFYVLLALFPAITAFISIYGLFSDPASVRDQLQGLQGVLPGGALQIIGEQLQRITSQESAKLGFGMIFGLGVALWSANAGMKTLFDAMNIVYEEEEKRGFIKLTLITLGFTLGTIVALIVALMGVVVLPIVLEFLHLGSLETVLLVLRWPILLVLVALGLSIIYRVGPSRSAARWRWIAPGSLFAAALWVVFSLLFSWYAQNFGSYDETYGSLGAAIGFMTWIWISTIVVLIGAELNAEMEHQTAIDSTTHAARPMGQRGATMADTLGETKG